MAKQNQYITGCRVERPATRSAADLRRADQALLERYQAVMRLAGGDPAAKRNPDQAVIRDFVTGRTGADAQAVRLPPRPMATRTPPRYNLIGIAASAALVVASIVGAASGL